MPSNTKTFYHVNEQDYTRFVSQCRTKGWSLPSSTSGLLRGSGKSGLLADVHFDAKTEELNVRVRQLGRGEGGFDTFFGNFWTLLRTTSDKASESP